MNNKNIKLVKFNQYGYILVLMNYILESERALYLEIKSNSLLGI